MAAGSRRFPLANVRCSSPWVSHNRLSLRFVLEPIACVVPALPRDARYVRRRPFMQKILDGGHLEYLCEHSQQRQRVLCRRGKILPKNPRCYNGETGLPSSEPTGSYSRPVGCRVDDDSVAFSKPFYRHRENVYYTCKHNNSLPVSNETVRCVNGNLSEQPMCHSSTFHTSH